MGSVQVTLSLSSCHNNLVLCSQTIAGHYMQALNVKCEMLSLFVDHRGVRSQLEALRAGFNTVFPMDRLGAFTPDEVNT